MAKKKTTAKKPAAKPQGKKGLAELKRTGVLMTFVKQNNGSWNHAEWLELVDKVKAKGYECDSDELGVLLEQKKEEYWAKQNA